MKDKIEKAVDIIYGDMLTRPLSLIFIKEFVPTEMKNNFIENPWGNDFVGWKMIDSRITNYDLELVKKQLGVNLPQTYKLFVQYKYFIELYTHNNAIQFEGITDKIKLDKIVSHNKESFYKSSVLDDGYIAVASFYDYGCVLLNTDEDDESVYVLMYDNLDRKYYYASSLVELLSLDTDHANNFIENHNKSWW